jgi:hypothetical protein
LWYKKSKTSHTKKINTYQAKELWADITVIPGERTLVFYFRHRQWAHIPHFHYITEILNIYIQNWYSQVWNNFKIVSRHETSKTLGWIETQHHEWIWFRMNTAIFADTIHLNHWTPEKQIPGTHFILGSAVTTDTVENREKWWDIKVQTEHRPPTMDGVKRDQYTPLNLTYFGWENTNRVMRNISEDSFWYPELPIKNILQEVLRAVRQAEEDMLDKLKPEQQVVHDILNP